MSFNLIDVFLLAVVLLSALGGWYRGFIFGLLDLARWILSFFAALYFYQPVARLLDRVTGWGEIWNQPVAFLLIIVLTSLVIQALGAALIRRLPEDIHRRTVNRILGI